MAHLRCDLRSELMDMITSVSVILPDNEDLSSVPVIYLFHGLADNCTGWTRYTSVERYARRYNAALVIPEVQRSFYMDMKYGLPYFRYVHDELPEICRRIFRIDNKPSRTYVMGLSMGGYAALKCLLRTPERYAGCAAFSAATDLQERVDASDAKQQLEYSAILGEELRVPPEDDLFQLAETGRAEKLPPIYMACGKQDDLLGQNILFAEKLKQKGASIQFEQWDGIHGWDFWDMAVCRAMDYLLNADRTEGASK